MASVFTFQSTTMYTGSCCPTEPPSWPGEGSVSGRTRHSPGGPHPGGWGHGKVPECFSKIIRFLKICLLGIQPQRQINQTQTHWKMCKNGWLFFLAWGFQGGIFEEWEGGYAGKINSFRAWAKFPFQLPVLKKKWQSHTREEMKREIFRLLIRPESPGPVSEAGQGNCRACGHRAAIPGGLASPAIISIRK